MLRQPQLETYINHLKCVHFEVTENANSLLNNALASWKTPQTSTLWLDDFGSGYAGINAIRGYHFDYVKIDKDFFWHLMQKESGRPLMDALVTFLSRNNHNVIIEGVESEAHKTGLREWSGLLFRVITGKKSALNNWCRKGLAHKNIAIMRYFYTLNNTRLIIHEFPGCPAGQRAGCRFSGDGVT